MLFIKTLFPKQTAALCGRDRWRYLWMGGLQRLMTETPDNIYCEMVLLDRLLQMFDGVEDGDLKNRITMKDAETAHRALSDRDNQGDKNDSRKLP